MIVYKTRHISMYECKCDNCGHIVEETESYCIGQQKMKLPYCGECGKIVYDANQVYCAYCGCKFKEVE